MINYCMRMTKTLWCRDRCRDRFINKLVSLIYIISASELFIELRLIKLLKKLGSKRIKIAESINCLNSVVASPACTLIKVLWNKTFINLLSEIDLHLAVGIAHKEDTEIALVHFCTGVDVIGIHYDEIPKYALIETLEKYPRNDFKNAFIDLVTKQAEIKTKQTLFIY
jgi:hypothetical protein